MDIGIVAKMLLNNRQFVILQIASLLFLPCAKQRAYLPGILISKDELNQIYTVRRKLSASVKISTCIQNFILVSCKHVNSPI